MTKRKQRADGSEKPGPAPKETPSAASRGKGRIVWVIAGVVVVLVVGALAVSGGSKNSGGAAGGDPQELKYMNRLLPAGYQEPKLAGIVAYSSTTPMSDVVATDAGSEISIPTDEIVSKRNVLFEYKRPDGKTIPLIAYLKPSGKLFVGVSFCPPCEGERQRIETDITLTCESCGTKRNLETGVGLSGACKLYPLDELPSKVDGDKVLLEKSVIDGWTPQPKDRPIGG